MRKDTNLVGIKFNRLLVISNSGSRQGGDTLWICKCDCGNETRTRSSDLKNGHTKSCGCYKRETRARLNRTHGMCRTKVYKIWESMKTRCHNEKSISYKNYGGRGITVCDSWKESFDNFFSDMGSPPSEDMSIDRIDNGKGYYKENCRWATYKDQARNRRSTIVVHYKNEKLTLIELTCRLKVNHKAIDNRLRRGWDLETALIVPVRNG